MLKVLLIFLNFLFLITSYGQNEKACSPDTDTLKFINVEVAAEFPGGRDSFKRFLIKKFIIPD